MSAPSAPTGKLSQEQIHAISALAYDHKGKPRWDGAGWIGACSNGHLIVAAITLAGSRCDECAPGGEGDNHPRYIALPRQEVLLAAFHLGGWDAVVTAAKELAGCIRL